MVQYISRDDIIEFANYNTLDESDYFGAGIAERMRLDAIKELCEELCKLPFVEIEEEPIKRGHWVSTQNNRWKAYFHDMCSECGWWNSKDSVCKGEKNKPIPLNYCPNCGAKMDDEVET